MSDRQASVYEVERDRHSVLYSGPLEVGECVRVVPVDDVVSALLAIDIDWQAKGYPRASPERSRIAAIVSLLGTPELGEVA
jgi:hypothetical protein